MVACASCYNHKMNNIMLRIWPKSKHNWSINEYDATTWILCCWWRSDGSWCFGTDLAFFSFTRPIPRFLSSTLLIFGFWPPHLLVFGTIPKIPRWTGWSSFRTGLASLCTFVWPVYTVVPILVINRHQIIKEKDRALQTWVRYCTNA